MIIMGYMEFFPQGECWISENSEGLRKDLEQVKES